MFELITPFYIKITNARAFEAIFAFFLQTNIISLIFNKKKT